MFREKTSVKGMLFVSLVFVNIIIIEKGFVGSPDWYYLLAVALPALIVTATKKPRSNDRGLGSS
ncbi:MAG TPA: hypothetical protein VI233_04625 [Puia sp.]